MTYVYANLGRAGLCNLLYPWARAEVFAHLYNLPIIQPRWNSFLKIGPWIRGERYKRYYGRLFNANGYVTGFERFKILLTKRRIQEGDAKKFAVSNGGGGVIVFSGMEGGMHPFVRYQAYLKKRLRDITNVKYLCAACGSEPFVGVHIRRGDFCASTLKTSNEWFVRATHRALEHDDAKGIKLIRVFSDGYPSELKFMQSAFNDKRVEIMPKNAPIHDLHYLSNATVLVASPHSTFSMWAVFLGQMPSVWGTRFLMDVREIYNSDVPKAIFVPEEI